MPDETTTEETTTEERTEETRVEREPEGRENGDRREETTEETNEDRAAATIGKLRETITAQERKLKEYEDRDKSETEKLTGRVETAERERDEWQRAAMIATVARQKNLPDVLADRLKGKDLKELSEDADRLLEQIGEREPEGGADLGAGPRGAARTGSAGMDALIRRAARRT